MKKILTLVLCIFLSGIYVYSQSDTVDIGNKDIYVRDADGAIIKINSHTLRLIESQNKVVIRQDSLIPEEMSKIEAEDTVNIGTDGIYVKESDGTTVHINRRGIRVYEANPWDTVDILIGDPDQPKVLKDIKTRWFLFDLGFDMLSTKEDYRLSNGIDPFELRMGKSTNVNIHAMQQRINLVNHHVNLKWGLTFEFHKHYFDNPVMLLEDQPDVTFAWDGERNLRKYRLSYTYLTMPVMLNFETNPKKGWKSFHFNIGAYGGPRIDSNFKVKGKDVKDKYRDNFQLSKWRYGIRSEIGYGPFQFYGTVALNKLFQDSKNSGYEVTPFSIGLIIIPF
jgi:hypothetical protein